MLALNGTINCYLKFLAAVKSNGLWMLPPNHVPPTPEQVKQVKSEAVARLQARNLPVVLPTADRTQVPVHTLAGTFATSAISFNLQQQGNKHTKSIELCTLIRWSVGSREGATLAQIAEDIAPYYQGVVTGNKRLLFAPGVDPHRYFVAYLHAMRGKQLDDGKWVIPGDSPPSMEEVRKLRNRVLRRIAAAKQGVPWEYEQDLEPEPNDGDDEAIGTTVAVSKLMLCRAYGHATGDSAGKCALCLLCVLSNPNCSGSNRPSYPLS